MKKFTLVALAALLAIIVSQPVLAWECPNKNLSFQVNLPNRWAVAENDISYNNLYCTFVAFDTRGGQVANVVVTVASGPYWRGQAYFNAQEWVEKKVTPTLLSGYAGGPYAEQVVGKKSFKTASGEEISFTVRRLTFGTPAERRYVVIGSCSTSKGDYCWFKINNRDTDQDPSDTLEQIAKAVSFSPTKPVAQLSSGGS